MTEAELIKAYEKSDFDTVIKVCEKRLKGKDKNNLLVLSLMGGALLETGKALRALKYFQHAYGRSHDLNLAYNLGRTWLALDNPKKAIPFLEKFHHQNSSDADGALTLAMAYTKNKTYETADAVLKDSLKKNPSDRRFIKNLALNAIDSKNYESALTYMESALASDTSDVELILSYVKLLDELSRVEHAYAWATQAISLDSDNQLANFLVGSIIFKYSIDADPSHFLWIGSKGKDQNVCESSLATLMVHFEKIRDWGGVADVINVVASGRYSKWLGDAAKAKAVTIAIRTCEWGAVEEMKSRGVNSAIDPFIASHVIENPKIIQELARLRTTQTRDIFHENLIFRKTEFETPTTPINIGFFAGEFNNHPVTQLLLGLLRSMDPHRFNLFAFSFTPARDDMTDKLEECVKEFVDLRHLNDLEVVHLARKYRLDVAVDLNGHTGNNRFAIFKARVARSQISYLGFPATTGSDYFDGIVLDDVVAPEEFNSNLDERVLRLPCCFMPRDFSIKPVEGLTREDYGLPECSPVFACYHKPEKITEEMFSAWCEIARTVDGVIWLPQMSKEIFERLADVAVKQFQLDPSQLIIATRVDSTEEHLGRLALADLFLDSYPYGGHTTFGDALFAGLPCITRFGQTTVSRLGLSFLTEAGLSDFACDNLDQYKKLAIDLANSPDELARIRDILANKRQVSVIDAGSEYAAAFSRLIEDLVGA